MLNFSRFEAQAESASSSTSSPSTSGRPFLSSFGAQAEANLLLRVTNALDANLGGGPTVGSSSNSTAGSTVLIDANMSACQTDLDLSLLDRISALLCKQPFYKDRQLLVAEDEQLLLAGGSSSSSAQAAHDLFMQPTQGLRENFLADHGFFPTPSVSFSTFFCLVLV